MSNLYDKIDVLCKEKGVNITTLCRESGSSRASLSDLKVGRKQSLSTETLAKIAKYFDVPTDFLLGLHQFEHWEQINQNRKNFLHYVDEDPDMLDLVWGINVETPETTLTKDFVSMLALCVESATPNVDGSWTVSMRPSYHNKEKKPTRTEQDRQDITNIIPMPKTYEVPLIGSIACGIPILAVEESDETVEVPEFIKADFALRCKGDSMINSRIFDGDIVYIRSQPKVENGQIAAVRIGDEATLKKVYYNGQRLILRAANPLYADLEYEGDSLSEIEILGEAVAFTSMLTS